MPSAARGTAGAPAPTALDPGAPAGRRYLRAGAGSATPSRVRTRSRLGGVAFIDGAIIPKDDGEELAHVLSLDLDDVPELRARYPQSGERGASRWPVCARAGPAASGV